MTIDAINVTKDNMTIATNKGQFGISKYNSSFM